MHTNRKIAYINGKIFTSDRANLYAEAMTVQDGRITWWALRQTCPPAPMKRLWTFRAAGSSPALWTPTCTR